MPLLANKLSLRNNTFLKPLIQIGIFLGIFVALRTLYEIGSGLLHKHLFIDEMTAKTAAYLINLITPEVGVQAISTHLSTQSASLNIANGCNGLEVMFLFIAAMIIAPIYKRAKLFGLLLGISYIFILNQIRILALFYSFRVNQALFWNLHSTIAPIMLIALTVLFMGYWLSRHQQYDDGI